MSRQQGDPRQVSLGMAAFLSELLLMMILAAIVKMISAEISVTIIMLARFLYGLPFLLAFGFWQLRGSALSLSDRRTMFLRCVVGLSGVTCWLQAVSRIDISKATAIVQTMPVFITILASVLIGERVGRRRWSAVLISLAGALILLRPDLAGWFEAGVAYAICAAFFGGFMFVYLRKLGESQAAITTAIWYNAFGAAAMLMWCVATGAEWPDSTFGNAMLLLFGALASVQQWLLALSHKLAPASTLAPLHYTMVPMSIVIGVLVFDEVITLSFLLGSGTIIGANYYIYLRERRAGARR